MSSEYTHVLGPETMLREDDELRDTLREEPPGVYLDATFRKGGAVFESFGGHFSGR